MPVFQGTHYARNIYFKDAEGAALDITGWEFRVHIRDDVDDDEPLLVLTTQNEGMFVYDGPAGHARFVITADQSLELPVGQIVFDVLRTDITPGPKWLFKGKFKVRKPVTRDD